jgi:hypothetical protein
MADAGGRRFCLVRLAGGENPDLLAVGDTRVFRRLILAAIAIGPVRGSRACRAQRTTASIGSVKHFKIRFSQFFAKIAPSNAAPHEASFSQLSVAIAVEVMPVLQWLFELRTDRQNANTQWTLQQVTIASISDQQNSVGQ